jgi:hypothetical protein
MDKGKFVSGEALVTGTFRASLDNGRKPDASRTENCIGCRATQHANVRIPDMLRMRARATMIFVRRLRAYETIKGIYPPFLHRQTSIGSISLIAVEVNGGKLLNETG